MSDPFIGEIRMVGFNFAPRDWATCNGQTIAITQNPTLYSILGNTYGGDGRTTFALPDMRGRTPLHPGTGGQPCVLGQASGQEAVILTPDQIPAHGHSLQLSQYGGDKKVPTDQVLGTGKKIYTTADSSTKTLLAEEAITNNDAQGAPHGNIQPIQVVNFIIALAGLYPSRN